MQRWRLLGEILATPLLVIADATPEPGSNRRLAAVVLTFQWLFRIYLIACIVGAFWLGAGSVWPNGGFGPLPDAILKIQEWLAVAVIGTFGMLFVLVAIAGFVQVVFMLWRGQRAMATVVSHADRRDEFRFTDSNGQTHFVSGPLASFGGAPHEGQQLLLVYLPGRPETFLVDRFQDKWLPPLVLFLLGLLILVPCVGFVLMR